jgi:hypothetical protein
MSSIILDSVLKSLEVFMSESAVSLNPTYVTSWADNGVSFIEGNSEGSLNGTSFVTIVGAPSASTRRIIKKIIVYNCDSSDVTITIQLNYSSSYYKLFTYTIAPNNSYEWPAGFGSGGAGVISVQNKTGIVTLNPDDFNDSVTTHKFTSEIEITKLAGIEDNANHYVHPLSHPESILALTDIETNNATTDRHGFLPKLSGNISDVLRGDGTIGGIDGYDWVKEGQIQGLCSGLIANLPFDVVPITITKSYTIGCVDIAACKGFYNDHTGVSGSYGIVNFAGAVNVPVVDFGINHIALHKSGIINISIVRQNIDDYVYLGYVWVYDGGLYVKTVDQVINSPQLATHLFGRIDDIFRLVFKSLLASGCAISEKSGPNFLELWMTEGTGYSCLQRVDLSQTDQFTKIYTFLGLVIVNTDNLNHVDTLNYNDDVLTPGLVEMDTNYWKKDIIRLEMPTGKLYYQYGQGEYASEEEALLAPFPTNWEDITLETASIYLATIVCKKGDTSIASRIRSITPNLQRIFGYGTRGTGAALTTADVISSTNKRYVTDANLTVINDTSGINTGDSSTPAETVQSIGELIYTSGSHTMTDPDMFAVCSVSGSPILQYIDWYALKNDLRTFFDQFYFQENAETIGDIIYMASPSPLEDNDYIPFSDESNGGYLKHIYWVDVKILLKDFFDAVYEPIGGVESSVVSSKLLQTQDVTITADYGAIVPDYYEITDGYFLEILVNSVFQID